MVRKFFIACIILTIVDFWLYQKDYFSWRTRTISAFQYMRSIDKNLLNNKSVALRQARAVIDDVISSNGGLGEGRCVREELIPGWSLDIVHSPRIDTDNKTENQCQSFLAGKTNVIEFDFDGRFVGIRKP